MAKFRAGKTGSTQVGAAMLSNQKWDVSFEGTELDTSNFEGNGRRSWLLGLEQLSWNLGALYNAQQNQVSDDPPGLYPRDDGTNMKLFMDKDAMNIYWSLPTWICSSSKMSVDVNGLVMFDASGKAQDDFVKITGNVA